MANITDGEWRQLLTLILSQRLEINAIESALKNAGILSDGQIREIRRQAANTASAWSSEEHDDVMALIRVHSSPGATMLVPPTAE